MLPGDVLVAVNDVKVLDWAHDDVVNLLRGCRARRLATFTLMTSRGNDPVSPAPASAVQSPRPGSAMAAPLSDTAPRVDYNQLYRKLYSPLPFVRGGGTGETAQARSTGVLRPAMQRGVEHAGRLTSDDGGAAPDVVLTSRHSAPPAPDIVGAGSPAPRGPGHAVRRPRQPRRSLPTPSVDLLSPLAMRRRRTDSRESSSQTGLNFSGTPDFIPASAYLDDDDRRRRATGRPPTGDLHDLAALTLDEPTRSWRRTDQVFGSSAASTPLLLPARRDGSVHSYDTDDASLPSSESFHGGTTPTAALPATAGTTVSGSQDRRAAFAGAGSESCNGYNARTEAVHSAASPLRRQLPPAVGHRQRSLSALSDAVMEPLHGPETRPTADGDGEPSTAEVTAKSASLDRRTAKPPPALNRVAELTEPGPKPHTAISVSPPSANIFLVASTNA